MVSSYSYALWLPQGLCVTSACIDCWTVFYCVFYSHFTALAAAHSKFITHAGNLLFNFSWMQLFLIPTIRRETSAKLRCCQTPGEVPGCEAKLSSWLKWLMTISPNPTMDLGDVFLQGYAAETGVRRQTGVSKLVKFLPFQHWNSIFVKLPSDLTLALSLLRTGIWAFWASVIFLSLCNWNGAQLTATKDSRQMRCVNNNTSDSVATFSMSRWYTRCTTGSFKWQLASPNLEVLMQRDGKTA